MPIFQFKLRLRGVHLSGWYIVLSGIGIGLPGFELVSYKGEDIVAKLRLILAITCMSCSWLFSGYWTTITGLECLFLDRVQDLLIRMMSGFDQNRC